jgi:hypothetical protein
MAGNTEQVAYSGRGGRRTHDELSWTRAATSLGVLACGLASAAALVMTVAPSAAAAGGCANEALRQQQGDAGLPDCRAYELVTPADKGAAQDMFAGGALSLALAASDGDRLALKTAAALGENPGSGSGESGGEAHTYVFSRSPAGWSTSSVSPPGSGQTGYRPSIFTPDLSVVGLEASTYVNFVSHAPGQSFEIGAPGGPYQTIATAPINDSVVRANNRDELLGGSSDLSSVFLASTDHSLTGASTGTDEGASDLYEWTAGRLRLVNVMSDGSLVGACGAKLGFGLSTFGRSARNAVSSNGAKVFFTSPDPQTAHQSEPGCEEPKRLYMRLNAQETVEVSAPEPGVVDSTGFHTAEYQGASADGAKVFFTTSTELTADDATHANELYEYNTNTHTLTRISRGVSGHAEGAVSEFGVTVSEDGSTVYFEANGQLTPDAPAHPEKGGNLYRYNTGTGSTRYIGTVAGAGYAGGVAPREATADGRFFLFDTTELAGGYNSGTPEGPADELYRYDDSNGSLKCVSCAPGGAPAKGSASLPTAVVEVILTPNLTPQLLPMSQDGRYVFFETNEELVPQDTNGTGGVGGERISPHTDVYEWEQEGAGGCAQPSGCVRLISSGKDRTPSLLLGASADGSNVFFSSHSQLAPQDTDEVGDVYDGRIGGGFAPPASPAQCSGDACQGAPPSPLVFTETASTLFSGPGNLSPNAVDHVIHKKKSKAKRHRKRWKHRRAKKTINSPSDRSSR